MLYYLFDYLEKTYHIPGAGLFQFLTFAPILWLFHAFGKGLVNHRNEPRHYKVPLEWPVGGWGGFQEDVPEPFVWFSGIFRHPFCFRLVRRC